ncbi:MULTISPECIES: nucleotidyl transferase AbiEii/AbiGii toxin family protein [Paraburkholderia]|uniref:Nucleotidyl transferase AbiEii/AbiGii toxin family protein n=1 Tax=Paraburkholderia phytofirmans TaxID=261302 RepID=A0ABW9BH43_9BURK|nr:nucleotidyl transferase AbiEii/AbiGii toxin family protein [Paraburkholderia sp. USG1]MDR8398454.1 nucleotidyl transferase AbiEii/AbiGii toxin family protein [Paraburkholderia sp. USG1]
MKTISGAQKELIDALVAEGQAGNLSAAVLEKDVHVADALHALSRLQHLHVQFVFCGGTSLSKAYGLIERMSEDVDLKVVLDAGHGLSKSAQRTHLGKLKEAVIDSMEALGFVIVEDEKLALNENRYFASGWLYETRYAAHGSLRPHLSLEFTVRSPRFETRQKTIGYLADQLAGRQGDAFAMTCIAVEETLAEKVLSFLRRHTEHRAGLRDKWDSALVRHIYDTYCIVQSDPSLVERAALHFRDLVDFDREEFPLHKAFIEDPKQCMTAALTAAGTEDQTRQEYEDVLVPLIYGSIRPTFAEAFAVFRTTALTLLATL